MRPQCERDNDNDVNTEKVLGDINMREQREDDVHTNYSQTSRQEQVDQDKERSLDARRRQ